MRSLVGLRNVNNTEQVQGGESLWGRRSINAINSAAQSRCEPGKCAPFARLGNWGMYWVQFIVWALCGWGMGYCFHHEGNLLPPRPALMISTAAAATQLALSVPV